MVWVDWTLRQAGNVPADTLNFGVSGHPRQGQILVNCACCHSEKRNERLT